MAEIMVNDRSLPIFPVYMGTRQSCPVSLLLFALYMEPYIKHLLQNKDKQPVNLNSVNLKVTAYADNIAVFSEDPIKALELISNEQSALEYFQAAN